MHPLDIIPIMRGSTRCLVSGPRDKIIEKNRGEFYAGLGDILPNCILEPFSQEEVPILNQRLEFGTFLELESRLGLYHSLEFAEEP